MPRERTFATYLANGGDIETLRLLNEKASPEFIAGKKPLDFKLTFENRGEFLVGQDEKGIVNVEIKGDKGSIRLIDTVKEDVKKHELHKNMLDKLLIVTPSYVLNQLPDKGLGGLLYRTLKDSAVGGEAAFKCVSTNLSFETFILVREPTNQKVWMLALLHEIGHAMNVAEEYFENGENPSEHSKGERNAWAQALRLVKKIKEKTGVNLLDIFSSKEEFKRIIYSALLTHKSTYAELDLDDVAFSDDLFDKGKLNRLK